MSALYTSACDTCGWTGTYSSAPKAASALHRHSCERQRRRTEAAARRAVREATIDRTPKPCLHKRANHQHGTRACYVLDACRCLPCAKANAEAENWRERQKAYGRYDKYVDADPVRAHLADLARYGIGLKTVAKRSGVGHGSLWKIVYGKPNAGPSRRVLRTTAEKLYAIQPAPENLSPAALDPHRTDTARTHLRALVALGWSMSKLGVRLGILPANMTPIVSGDRTLTRATVDAIEKLYAELCMTLPPETNQRERIAASRSRRLARERGWLPPLALDEGDELELDGPDIDEAAIERRQLGDKSVRLNADEQLLLVEQWLAAGRSAAECQRVTGLNVERILRASKEAAA